MEAVRNRIEEARDQLEGGRNDREFDLFTKGMIRSFREILELQPAGISQEEIFEDESSV